MFYLREMSHDEVESIFLHVGGLTPVRRLQDLQDILHSDVPLQVGLTEDLQHKLRTVLSLYLSLTWSLLFEKM